MIGFDEMLKKDDVLIVCLIITLFYLIANVNHQHPAIPGTVDSQLLWSLLNQLFTQTTRLKLQACEPTTKPSPPPPEL